MSTSNVGNRSEGAANELLARFAKNHDAVAYSQLYALVCPGLQRFAARFVDAEEAQDVVQEVFSKLYREPQKFWKSEKTSAWAVLATATRNRATDAGRQKGRRKETSYETMRERGDEPEPVPSMIPDSGPDLPSLEEMLKVLEQSATKSERALFRELVASEHWGSGTLDYESLAERQGATVGNIYQRMSRLRGRVRRAYGGVSGFLATVAAAAWSWLTAPRRRRWAAVAILIGLFTLCMLRMGRREKPGQTLPLAPVRGVQARLAQVAPGTSSLPTNGVILTVVVKSSGSNDTTVQIDTASIEVIVFYWGVSEGRKALITPKLRKVFGRFSTHDLPVEIVSNGLDDAGEIYYNSSGGEDMKTCALAIRTIIREADPSYEKAVFLADRDPGRLVDELTWKSNKRLICVVLTP